MEPRKGYCLCLFCYGSSARFCVGSEFSNPTSRCNSSSDCGSVIRASARVNADESCELHFGNCCFRDRLAFQIQRIVA